MTQFSPRRGCLNLRAALVLSILFLTSLTLFVSLVDFNNKWHQWKVLVPTTSSLDGSATFAVPKIEDIKHLHQQYKWYTDAKLRWLTACMARGDCPANADKVVIFGTFHCLWAVYENYLGGEGVWCRGMVKALEDQGFTVLQGGDNDWEYMYHIYRQIPDLVRVIVSEEGARDRHGTSEMYLKSRDRPDGIPAWKFFAVSYYPAGWSTSVGRAWIVTAEPDPGDQWDVEIDTRGNAWVRTGNEQLQIHATPDDHTFTYLGYPVHPQPDEAIVVPWDERPNRVWIMGKYGRYFHDNHAYVYNMSVYEKAYAELSQEFEGFEFVGAMEDDRNEEDQKKWGPIPSVIRNIGKLDPVQFKREFGKSRLMLGLGSPTYSPSPYEALAKAVPFANPHRLREGGSNDDDRTWAFAQHPSLQRIPEPYVYQVAAFNYTSFVETIRKALRTPIRQLRLERMREEVVQQRMADFVTADWYAAAKGVWEERNRTGETDLFEL